MRFPYYDLKDKKQKKMMMQIDDLINSMQKIIYVSPTQLTMLKNIMEKFSIYFSHDGEGNIVYRKIPIVRYEFKL